MTPLMVAAEKRLLEVMKRLVGLGINLDLQNKVSVTSNSMDLNLHLLIFFFQLGQTALMLAAREGNNKIIEFLIENAADDLLQDQVSFVLFIPEPRAREIYKTSIFATIGWKDCFMLYY